VPNVSAIGDVITFGKPGHPSWPSVDGRGHRPGERLAGREFHPINYDHVPKCTYCDRRSAAWASPRNTRGPRVRRAGRDLQLRRARRARIANETEGLVKIVAEKKYDEILAST